MPNADDQGVRPVGEAPRTAAERGREVRQRLVRAAVELIPERGWNAVSTRILAQRAGLAPGLVHYHFESLQALLREATLASMRESLQAIDMIFEQADTLESGLDMLLGALDGYTGDDPASLLFVEAYLASLRDPRLAHELASLLVDFRRRFALWLAARNQAAPEATAAVLAAALDGVLLHRALGPDLAASSVRQVLGRLLVRAEAQPVLGVQSPKGKKGADKR
jgi:AcrR family transcriptional regulator